MRRRRYLALSAAALAGCSSSGDQDSTDTTTARPTEPPTAVPEPEPISYSDSGVSFTEAFDIAGGFTAFEMSHDGSSNFIVELQTANGGRVTTLANAIGSWWAAYPLGLNAGEYQLSIDADGAWDITIYQPRPTQGDMQSLPVEGSDRYPNYIGPVAFPGNTQIAGDYNGDSNFIVEVLSFDGYNSDLLFNEIGAFEGETMYSGEGYGWLRVQATGPWAVGAYEP